MNHSTNCGDSTERPCGALTALLPLGMSCRGRAEAFARSLTSALRTLGTQPNESTPITSNTGTDDTWFNSSAITLAQSNVTNHQPVATTNGLHEPADSYFDFDIPGSPADECEYARLINTTTTTTSTATPFENASESGYVCASPMSSIGNNISNDHSETSSTDEPFFDPDPSSDNEQRSLSLSVDFYDCDDVKKVNEHEDQLHNTFVNNNRINNNNENENVESHTESLSTKSLTNQSNAQTNDEINVTEDSSASPHITLDTQQCPNNHVAIELERTNSISTNETIFHHVTDVQEIPKYERKTHQDTLTVDNFVNGHTSEEEEEPPPKERFRRSSSLKTGKTPPGTPGRKKIVRFADVLGLDLADVRTFLDEIPRVPKSAFDELIITTTEPPISLGQRLDKIIVPLFQQPCASPNFLDTVQLQNVALENAAVTDPICLTITGIVRVRNLDFHKSVHVRYSLDSWRSYSDLQAEYVENSCDGFSDKFSFTVFGNSMEIGQRIEIAIRFSCKGEQFWDNNHGVNYCFQCMPATAPQLQTTTHSNPHNENPNNPAHLHDSWCGSFY